jgi:hypothetical protein
MLQLSNLRRLLVGLGLLDGSRDSPSQTEKFSPTYADVRVARAMLKAFGLPTEIALEILEWAEYQPVRKFASSYRDNTYAPMASAPGNGMGLCLKAGVLARETLRDLAARQARVKVKEIEFTILSRDQGWTSEDTAGTFNTSSWLEVSILRPFRASSLQETQSSLPLFSNIQSPAELQLRLLQQGETLVTRSEEAGRGIQDGEGNYAWYLQGNRVASRGQFTEYRVVWAIDHHEGNEGAGDGLGFLEALQEGDSIIVLARAKVSYHHDDVVIVC